MKFPRKILLEKTLILCLQLYVIVDELLDDNEFNKKVKEQITLTKELVKRAILEQPKYQNEANEINWFYEAKQSELSYKKGVLMKNLFLGFLTMILVSGCSTTPQISEIDLGAKEYSNFKGGVVKHDLNINFKEITNQSLPRKILDQINNICLSREFILVSQKTIPVMSYSVWFLGILPFIQEPAYRNEYYLNFECINDSKK